MTGDMVGFRFPPYFLIFVLHNKQKMKNKHINTIIAICLIAIAAVARVLNARMHMPNLVPIAGIGLFGGAVLRDRKLLAFLAPMAGQFLADAYFQFFTTTPGFYPGQQYTYIALIAAAGLGLALKNVKATSVLPGLFGASTLFFLISNFGFFMGGWNGYSFAGLEKTYIDAIPFFRNTLAADMIGGIVLFGGYFLTQKLIESKMQQAKA